MTIWLTARSAGLAALLLLTVATALGASASRSDREPGRRYIIQYVHRVAAALGIGALAVHILTVLADTYAKVGLTGALVPFTSGYRATAVGLGTIAAYLLVAVAAFGFARGRMAVSAAGARVWRAVHASAYAAWAIALVHGFASGTDSAQPWVRLLYLSCLTAVPAALALRLSVPHPKRSARQKVVTS